MAKVKWSYTTPKSVYKVIQKKLRINEFLLLLHQFDILFWFIVCIGIQYFLKYTNKGVSKILVPQEQDNFPRLRPENRNALVKLESFWLPKWYSLIE